MVRGGINNGEDKRSCFDNTGATYDATNGGFGRCPVATGNTGVRQQEKCMMGEEER